MAVILFNYCHACLWMVRPCFLRSFLPVTKGWRAVSAQGCGSGRRPREQWVGREGTAVSAGGGSSGWPWGHGEEAPQGVTEIDLDSGTSRPAAASCRVTTCGYCPLSPSRLPPRASGWQTAPRGYQCNKPHPTTTAETPRGALAWGCFLPCLRHCCAGGRSLGSARLGDRPRWHPSARQSASLQLELHGDGWEGVWGLWGRSVCWSRVGRGLTQASGAGERSKAGKSLT